MSGQDAIAQIRRIDECSEGKAIDQLRVAVAKGFVKARLPDPRNPDRDLAVSPFPSTFAGGLTLRVHPEVQAAPTPQMWSKAEIRADGTVRFRESPIWYSFVVLRRNIEEWERPHIRPKVFSTSSQVRPTQPFDHEKTTHPEWPEKARGPKEAAARAAIAALWKDILTGEQQSIEIKNRIRRWCKSNDKSIPSDRTIERAFAALKWNPLKNQ
jgi:hypothetical protein